MKHRHWYKFFGLMLCSLLVFTSCTSSVDGVKNLKASAGSQVIVLGDSIAEGYGVAAAEAFPSVLSRNLGIPIVNRGVSGDTTAMGLARLQKDVLDADPWLVVVELGGNDFLRKIPLTETEQNLRQIIAAIQAKKAIAVILGINIGPFKGNYYELYQRLAKDTQSFFIPEIFKGVLDDTRYRQDDAIHPNAAGQKILGDRISQQLKPLLDQATWPAALLKYKSN
jgi:acyl-CoA thioesterase I